MVGERASAMMERLPRARGPNFIFYRKPEKPILQYVIKVEIRSSYNVSVRGRVTIGCRPTSLPGTDAMGFVAIVLATLTDPSRWLIFGGLGVVGASWPSRKAGLVSCAIIAVMMAYFVPIASEDLPFATRSIPPPEPGYTALPEIEGTKYFNSYGDRFIGSMSHAETEMIKRRLDQMESDCLTILGPPPFRGDPILPRCRSAAQWGTFVVGTLQFALGAAFIYLGPRRRRVQSDAV